MWRGGGGGFGVGYIASSAVAIPLLLLRRFISVPTNGCLQTGTFITYSDTCNNGITFMEKCLGKFMRKFMEKQGSFSTGGTCGATRSIISAEVRTSAEAFFEDFEQFLDISSDFPEVPPRRDCCGITTM